MSLGPGANSNSNASPSAGLRLPRRYAYARGPVDAAPLLNVILLLFIFFALGSAFVLQPGIKVDLPRSPFVMGAPAQSSILTLLAGPDKRDPATGLMGPGEALLFFNDEALTLADLPARLDAVGGARGMESRTLLIRADHSVPNGLLVDVMNLAMARKWAVILAAQPPAGGAGASAGGSSSQAPKGGGAAPASNSNVGP
ncbi:Biopolymer transport protein ExbD [Verrucomicrobium sp. GAS474]|uniref:ExbD/TolR family protein n=1 Tax=Verrucomicrobium sp. GAS474 TaxID=1882831 RepID=UPI000879A693|nr:biopolymer transporter ExbD [Verrucomicrobium sp. GAS474]SDU29770.1 Biopolymer transport protein ExbD [Verrucomicrobium sp. GAS474]